MVHPGEIIFDRKFRDDLGAQNGNGKSIVSSEPLRLLMSVLFQGIFSLPGIADDTAHPS